MQGKLSNNGKLADIQNVSMYKLVSTNSYFDGMKFDSLEAALTKARKANSMGYTTDIVSLTSGKVYLPSMQGK